MIKVTKKVIWLISGVSFVVIGAISTLYGCL